MRRPFAPLAVEFDKVFQAAGRRRGSILLLAAACLVVIMAFAAFSIDAGYLAFTKTQLQNASDAAALGAALELNPMANQDEVEAAVRRSAVEVAAQNRAGDHASVIIDPNADVELGRRIWNPGTRRYDVSWGKQARPYNVVRVTARRSEIQTTGPNGQPQTEDRRLRLFFAPVIGHDASSLETTSTATFQPRDMMLVLDYSASMNDDSEFRSIGQLPQTEIEANIRKMWDDLQNVAYGKLTFSPQFATLSGQPAQGPIPHIDVTWKGTEISVTSTKDLSNVVLQFSDGRRQKFDNLSRNTGTFRGTGRNSGRKIVKAWVKSGQNSSGDGPGYGERFEFSNSDLVQALDLNTVPYPYASGNWNSFVNYVNTSRNVRRAGYRYQFGMMTLINYWNEKKPKNDQTADLWKISQQPITALKDATDLLLDYLTEVESEDQIGLSVYTYPDANGARLESPLTRDYDLIKTLSRQRQAGHYDYFTNIGAGMREARQELENNARPNAARTMVLMTDGIANRSSTGASPRQFALDEAQLAAQANIKIMTVSLGLNADTDLMQQIADITGGTHFHVPGGSSVEDYEEDLKNVFAEIAADRPLKLIRDDAQQ